MDVGNVSLDIHVVCQQVLRYVPSLRVIGVKSYEHCLGNGQPPKSVLTDFWFGGVAIALVQAH